MRSALLITAFVASALAGPTGYRESCARHCDQDNVFSYQRGRSYEYEYSVTTNTALPGDHEQGAVVTITAHAHVDVTAPCEHTLRLTEVSLQGSSHTEEMAAALTRSSLRFSFQDGRVEELCAAPTEEPWVLNFKRGLLSAFQTSETRPGTQEVQETDILGVCVTRYENRLEGDLLTINKVREVSSCTKRADLSSYIASASYSTDSPVQGLPLLHTTSGCQQTVRGGILVDAQCDETHTFQPFSGGRGGATTTANTHLKLVSRDGPAPTTPEIQFVRKTPVFEAAVGATPESQAEIVTALLTQLDEAAHQEVRPQAPALFSRLVIALRNLDYPVLSRVYAASAETHSRKFLVDAMPLVGTAAAAGVVRDMYTNGDLTHEEIDAWFTSLTFLKNPTSDMFTAIAPMLETSPSQSAMLGTSALVNTFCKINSDCGDDSGVQQVMRRVEAHLGSGCRAVNEEQKINILLALRALGNAGRWVNAKQVLQRCFTEENDMEVRVAAIEAWRHTPCEYDRSSLLAAYQDEVQDSEVRIAAYLSVMSCPTPAIVAAIKDRLTSEGVNQVGSFVWTHLTNLQESAAPGKEWARILLGDELLVNKFSTEALRFSRNYESSFFMKELNVGAQLESNVIFSSKSYLPRSAMLNLTFDLFGESVNLFEVGGRIEGFEVYLERLFGPNGYFPEDTVAAALRNLRQQKREAEATTLEQFLEEVTDEPRGSYYLRLFGNDVHYRRFQGLSDSSDAASSPLALLMELARGGNVDYTKSYQLLDTHYSVPTVAGLPLTIGAKSTATVALRMDGSFTAESLTDMHIQGHLRPSGAVHVDGVMLVDAHVTRAGVKVSSTMHSSTSLEGKVRINSGEVDVTFDTPKEQMEIIDLDTKFFYVQDDEEVEQEREGRMSVGCTPGYTGMALCGEVVIPPYSSSWLGLPTTLRAYLKKTDTQTGYIFRFTKSSNEVNVLFDNPEAQNSLRVALTLQAQENKVVAKLDSFLTTVDLSGEYTWLANKKAVKAGITVDGTRHLMLDAGLLTSLGGVMRVEPYLVLSMAQRDVFNFKATLMASPQENKYSVDGTFTDAALLRPIIFKAAYDGAAAMKTLDIAYISGYFDMSLDGKFSYDASSITTNVNLEYSGRWTEKFRANPVLLLQKQQEGDATTYSSKLTIENVSTEKPIVADYSITFSPSDLNSKFRFIYGPVDMVVEENWSHTYEDGVRKIIGEVTSTCAYLEVDQTASTEITIAPNAFFLRSVMHRRAGFDQSKKVFLIDLKREPGVSLTADVDLETAVQFNAHADLRKANPRHYTAQITANTRPQHGSRLSLLDANASFRDISSPGTFSINAEGSVSVLENTVTLTSVVYGDPQQGKVDLQTRYNGKEYGLKMETTRTSLLIDANLLKHVVVNANINHQGPEKSLLVNVEWDKEINPANAFKIEAMMQPDVMTAKFRFLEKEFSARSRLMQDGVEVEAAWYPAQRLAAVLRYSLGAASSLTATLDTTFPGWEKQSIDVSAALQANEVTCRASATWRNNQQAAFAVMGRLQPGGSVHAEVILTSSATQLERLTLTFDHKMAGAAISTSLEGAWNDRQLNASFQLAPSDSGLDGVATFTSPLTKPFMATLNHQLRDASLDSTFLTTYDNVRLIEFSTVGRLSLAPGKHDVDLSLTFTTNPHAALDAETALKYSLNGSALNLLVDGKAGQRKMMLNVNGEKTVTADSTTLSGDLRFLTPFTQPLTASLSHTHDARRFTSQFEITRIWSTYSFGSLKAHAEGHILSENDINLSAYISSPETKGSFSFVHKVENNNLTTVAKVYANREVFSVSVKGTLDSTARVLNLEGDVSSSFEGLEIKVKVDSKRDGNTQNTQVDLARGAQHATLSHSFTATDVLNWENIVTLNDQYSLRNKMMRVAGEYQHQMEAAWDEQRLALDGRFAPVLTANSRKLDAHLSLVTPWECFANNKIDFHFEQEVGKEAKASAEIEYKPGSKIMLSTRNKCSQEGELFSTASLTTPFWQPLSYTLSLTSRPQKVASLVLTLGEAETTIRVAGDYRSGNANAELSLDTPSLEYPLVIEGSYDLSSPSKVMSAAVTHGSKYEAKVTSSGSVANGRWELSLWQHVKFSQNGPWETVHHLEGRWEHQLETTPFNIKAEVQVESALYQVIATLDETSFKTSVVLDGREGSLAARWLLQPTNSNLTVAFQSPIDVIKDFNMAVAYDMATMEGQAKMKYNTQEIDLLAKMVGETFVFEIKTPFSGWEILGASFFASTTAINAHVFRNERKIEVTGTQHLRPAKGKLELVITTPYAGLETISFDASYNFYSENKTVKFKTIYGTAEIFARGVIKMADPLAPKVTLNITTPFTELRTLRATAEWRLSGASKTAAAKIIYNEQEFSWNLEAAPEGSTQRVSSRATTPFPGWTQASLEASISVSESPYEVRVTVQKEGVTNDFRGRLMLSGNTIHGEVSTPIPGWEKFAVDGTYARTHTAFSAAIRATRGNDKYEMNTDVLFDAHNPKLKVEMTAPATHVATLKLEVESSLAGPQKTFHAIIINNDAIFSADATLRLENKTGFLTINLRSPLPGFSSLEVEGNYDLRGDVKKSELNVTKEGVRQHFAVAATLDDNHVVLDVATPFPGFQVMKMDADYTSSAPGQHLVVASFVRDHETYNFSGNVEMQDTSVAVRLTTPITAISNVVLDARYKVLSGAIQGSIHFEKNDDVFELRTQCHHTPTACSLSVEAATPVPGWNNLSVNFKYNAEPNKLTAEATVQRDSFRKEVSVIAQYGVEQGNLTVRTPLAGWEVLGAEYKLTVASGNEATALAKIVRNTREFTFSAYGRYTQESIALRFQTPLQGYEESSLEASVNVASSSAKANLQVGPYTFSLNGSYTIGNMFLEVATPFPVLRFGSVAVKHAVSPGGLMASLTVVHNENNYFLVSEANVSPRSSLVVLQAKTPIPALPNATLKLRYNLNNKAELLAAQLTAGDHTYGLLVGGELQEKMASLKMEMNTPFSGWTQVKFGAKVDLTQDDKALEVVVEREGSIKAITVHGKMIGSALDFDLRTPFAGLNRVNVSGNLNRAKRSLQFQMMNDAGEASILAGFNGVKFELKTPFSRMEEVSFEVKKEDNKYSGTWKRNENYLTLEMVKDPAQQTVSLEVKSELQGWEFLALAGRLDQETEEAYASGQINERKVELTISGKRDDSRNTRIYDMDLKTPYDDYQHVTGELRFSQRRRLIKIASSSSPFKMEMKSTPRRGLQLKVFVPNPTQPTELKVDLKPERGNINFTSRFAALRSLHYNYTVTLEVEFEMTHRLEVNGLEMFTTEFKANPLTEMLHLDIHARLEGRHTNLHIHREGFSTFNVILKREVTEGGTTTEKQLSMKMKGTGELPEQGTIHATLTNSFVAEPRTTTIHAEIDRRSSPKTINLEVALPGQKVYVFDLKYNLDLENPTTGDFEVHINTPDRMAAPWKHISGKWDAENPREIRFELDMGGIKAAAVGTVGLLETDLVFTRDGSPSKYFLQWKFYRSGDQRDYFMKIGPDNYYRMLKLKGTVHGINDGNVEGGFKASFQPHEFLFTSSWNHGGDGVFTAQGDFTYGPHSGSHKLEFHRDAASRSANFEFSANSNHPDYRRVLLKGNYDVLNKLVFKAELSINNRVNKIDIDISDLNPSRSRNSIEAALPFLPPGFQVFQMTITHDFRNNNNKFIIAEAKLGERESYLRARWERSADFNVLEGALDIRSIFIGQVQVSMKYDVSDINNAQAEVHYLRKVEGEPEKKVDATWTRKRTPNRLEAAVTLDTTFERLQHARAYTTADFSQLFNLDAGLDFNDKQITINLNVNSETVEAEITTPFEGFETIKGTITYNLGDKIQTVTLHYERGSQQVHMDLVLNRKNKKRGDLKLNLTTPFEVLRTLKIDASWSRKQATVDYVRNDVHVSMRGTAQVDTNKSNFNMSFTAPSGKAVTISAAYDVEAFIAGTGTSPAKLAGLNIDIGETNMKFELKGLRSSERLYVEMHGMTSFLSVSHLHLKLDSELNMQKREGTFEFRLNDFVFEVHNEFERYEDGYYIKSRVESSLTPLPALVFGLGRRGPERIFTLGYGEEKELTFSIRAKNNFRTGFSGSVDIPNFGYDGVQYDVTYGFPNNDELEVKLEAELGSNEHLEAEFEYCSEGVKARLTSPFTGEHSARFRRSVTTDSFFSEVGFDDYNLKLRGGFTEGDIKRGMMVEADILGRQFLFNYQLQSDGRRYTEGKLVLHTPFRGWEKMGGVFNFSYVNRQVLTRAEVFVPFFLNIPRVTASVNLDFNNKIEGEATLNVAGEQFSVRSNLVGTSLLEGYQGSVRLQTPFLALPSLEVDGKIRMTSLRNLEADLKVTNIYTTYEIDLKYEISSNQIMANATILPRSAIGSKISILLESLAPTQNKMELRVDDNYLLAEYTMANSAFAMNMDTRLGSVRRQLSVDTRYSMLEDLEGTVMAVLGEQRHKVQGTLSIVGTRLHSEVILDSSLIDGVRRLEFSVTAPNTSFEHVSFSVSLAASETHSFSLELDTRAGVATAKINTPALPSTTVNLQLTWPRTALSVTTPTARHTAAVSWRQTRKMPADQIINAELDTPLLGRRYALRMVMGGGRSKAVVKAELEVGGVTHSLEANTFMGATNGGFSLDIQTPFMNIQKATFRGSLDMSDTVELQVVASVADVTNTFVFNYNANKGTLLAEATSPFIPTGMMKATAEISNVMPDMSLQVALMNAYDVISGRLDIKVVSNEDVTARAMISTPLQALKTANFLIKYQKADMTHLIVSLDHPISFTASAKFANTDDKVVGNVTVKSSIINFEYVEADLEIPLTEFSPRASLTLPTGKYGIKANYATEGYLKKAAATLYLDDQAHGGNFSFRSKAPYELAYKYHILNHDSAFHLRTDSSFFTLLM